MARKSSFKNLSTRGKSSKYVAMSNSLDVMRNVLYSFIAVAPSLECPRTSSAGNTKQHCISSRKNLPAFHIEEQIDEKSTQKIEFNLTREHECNLFDMSVACISAASPSLHSSRSHLLRSHSSRSCSPSLPLPRLPARIRPLHSTSQRKNNFSKPKDAIKRMRTLTVLPNEKLVGEEEVCGYPIAHHCPETWCSSIADVKKATQLSKAQCKN
ncbi:hypothetical protein M5K25_021444 [Dendrobium thyrsiflorum]|uniref:Uncharacterized protein n=1 Tax=Dendrobium thyrsiflorum TaxID=117978 RepID=A0ABD0UCC8_DENTH